MWLLVEVGVEQTKVVAEVEPEVLELALVCL
jgi:hypothetical protein